MIFDVAPVEAKPDRPCFDASVAAYLLGDILVARADFDRQRFERSRRKIAADGLDHYLVQIYAKGGLAGEAGRRDRLLRSGDVQILDLGRPSITHAEASQTVAVVVPRSLLDAALGPRGDLHGLVLRADQPTGGLLGDYLASLASRLGALSLREAPSVAHATMTMIAACFGSSAELMAQSGYDIETVTLLRVKRHIEQRLSQPELGPDMLCADLRLSRSTLYRLFAPAGGVAKYIQDRRLTHAMMALRRSAYRSERIIDVAFNCGFSSEAHFSRQFRKTFGVSPRDARENWARSQAEDSRHGGGYEHWLAHLAKVGWCAETIGAARGSMAE